MRLLIHERSAAERRFIGKADVGLSKVRDRKIADSAGLLEAPDRLELPAIEVEKQPFIEIRDARNRRVVTVIELLSPSNKKPGSDQDDYLAKRRQILAQHFYFVEIDLRRRGDRPSPSEIPPCDYYVLVSQYEDRPGIGLWPFGLRDPLPVIPVPLTFPESPISVALKPIFDHVFDATAFADHIYLETPDPPRSPEDEAWAREIAGLA